MLRIQSSPKVLGYCLRSKWWPTAKMVEDKRRADQRAWDKLYIDSCSSHSHFLMAMHICLHSSIRHNEQLPFPLLRYTDGGGGINQGYINIMKHLKWLTHRKSTFVWLMFLELPVHNWVPQCFEPVVRAAHQGSKPFTSWVSNERNKRTIQLPSRHTPSDMT